MEIPKIYSNLSDLAVQCTPILKELYEPCPYSGHLELEARFGQIINGSFRAEVGADFGEYCAETLTCYPDWVRSEDAVESRDFFYNDNIRSSVSFDSIKGTMQVSHLRKRKLHDINVQTTATDLPLIKRLSMIRLEPLYDIRISMSVEEPLTSDQLETIVLPNYVRIKERTSFYYSSRFTREAPLWQFAVTKTWSGHTYADAETQRRTSNPAYEIECEALNPYRYLQLHHVSDKSYYVVLSLLMKMYDFLKIDTRELNFRLSGT